MRADFMSQVVAYDLPIGYCDATWDKEFMADLRRKADWTQGRILISSVEYLTKCLSLI
jgi:hypothetical protein